MIHVRTVCSSICQENENEEKFDNFSYQFGGRVQKNKIPGIIEQLLVNGVDGEGLLIPIRNWLLNNTINSNWILNNNNTNNSNIFELSIKQFTDLLKEFNVMGNTQEIIAIITEIGIFPSINNFTEEKRKNKSSRRNGRNSDDENFNENRLSSNEINESENRNLGELSQFNGKSMDARLLIHKLIKVNLVFYSVL